MGIYIQPIHIIGLQRIIFFFFISELSQAYFNPLLTIIKENKNKSDPQDKLSETKPTPIRPYLTGGKGRMVGSRAGRGCGVWWPVGGPAGDGLLG
jgi:hypothetical protein